MFLTKMFICVCVFYVDNILVALEHSVECVEVSLSVSPGLPQSIDLLLHALLFLCCFTPQSLQGSLQSTEQGTPPSGVKKSLYHHRLNMKTFHFRTKGQIIQLKY